jgi:hypothetical protein
MLLTTVRTTLVNAAAVTAIVGTRVELLTRPQAVDVPAVCLQVVSTTPVYGLEAWHNLDENQVQIDCYASTYTVARDLAAACRAAMEAADHELTTEFDNFDEGAALSGLARVTQQYAVWS